jgi:hypothetical protein
MKKLFVAGVCVLAVAVAGTLYFSHGQLFTVTEGTFPTATTTPTADTIAATTPAAIEARVAPAGSREYHNATYRFSLFYPQELSVSERAEGGGAMTVTFQNVDEVKGFQVFIVPFAEPQVSEARFRQDEPSGVRTNFSNITIDGAAGATFNSTDVALGETREIWFVHGGYLYEVTTLQPLEAWFDPIMSTWKFI